MYEGVPVVGIEAQATGLLCVPSEDMTKETKILESTTFLSLNQSAKKWANEIIKSYYKYERKNFKDKIISNNFDIKTESKKIENKYFMIVKKGIEK